MCTVRLWNMRRVFAAFLVFAPVVLHAMDNGRNGAANAPEISDTQVRRVHSMSSTEYAAMNSNGEGAPAAANNGQGCGDGDVMLAEQLEGHDAANIALFAAVNERNPEMVQETLEEWGADPNAKNERGLRAVAIATFNGDHEIVDMLLKAHADVNTALPNGDSLVKVGTLAGHESIVRLLLEAKADASCVNDLMTAITKKNAALVQLLLTHGADANEFFRYYNNGKQAKGTSLCLAIEAGNKAVVDVLLDAQANVNVGDDVGVTPLMIAARFAFIPEMVSILLDKKADVNAVAESGVSALMEASCTGNAAIISALVNSKASLDLPDKKGNTALALAISRSHRAAVCTLLAHKANVCVQNHEKIDCLTRAYNQRDTEIQRMVFDAVNYSSTLLASATASGAVRSTVDEEDKSEAAALCCALYPTCAHVQAAHAIEREKLCPACTFINEANVKKCEMCDSPL